MGYPAPNDTFSTQTPTLQAGVTSWKGCQKCPKSQRTRISAARQRKHEVKVVNREGVLEEMGAKYDEDIPCMKLSKNQ